MLLTVVVHGHPIAEVEDRMFEQACLIDVDSEAERPDSELGSF